jgi:hypothetical protein
MGTSLSEPFDIDGDGQPDVLVPEPAPDDCVQDFHFAVYVTRGACGHRVGIVHGMVDLPAVASAPRSAGLRDLVATTERQAQRDPREPAKLVRVTRTYRFDGTAYREVNKSTTASVCHHCPSVHCEHELQPE